MFDAADLESMQATVADTFVDAASVARGTAPTFNSDTGTYSAGGATTYTGPCKIRLAPRVGQDIDAGETEIRGADFNGHFPVDTDMAVNDVVTVTASATDPAIVGRRLRVTDVALGSWQLERVVVLQMLT